MKQVVILSSIIILIGGLAGNFLRFLEQTPDRGALFERIPYQTEYFTGAEHRFSEASYEVLQADTSTLRRYVDQSGHTLWLFVAYFSSQKYGSQIHSPKNCLPGGGWRIDSSEPYLLTLSDGSTRMVNRLLINEGKKQQLMLYWFRTRGGNIRNEFALKWDLVQNSLFLRPTDAAFIRVTLPIERNDIAGAMKRSTDFLNQTITAIESALPSEN